MAGRVLLVSAIAMVMMCHYVSAVFFPPPHPLLMPAITGLSPFPGLFPAFSPGPLGLSTPLLLAQQRSALRRRARSRSSSSSSSSSSSVSNRFVSRTGATGPIPLAGGLILDSQVVEAPIKSETAFQMASPRVINVVVPQESVMVEAVPEIVPAVATNFGGDINDATITIKSSDPASVISSIKSNVQGSISDTEFIIDASGSGGDQSSRGQQVVQTIGALPPSAVSLPATAVAFGGAGGATVGAATGGAPLQGFQTFGSGSNGLDGNFVQSLGSQTHHQSSSSSSNSAAAAAASSLNDIRSSRAAMGRQGLNLVPLGAGPVPFAAGPVPIGGVGPLLGR